MLTRRQFIRNTVLGILGLCVGPKEPDTLFGYPVKYVSSGGPGVKDIALGDFGGYVVPQKFVGRLCAAAQGKPFKVKFSNDGEHQTKINSGVTYEWLGKSRGKLVVK